LVTIEEDDAIDEEESEGAGNYVRLQNYEGMNARQTYPYQLK
jgi:hypothetical protein